jgi:hypothetical protein
VISERAFSQAFHFFWRELLPFMTPHYITLFNEAYSAMLTGRDGTPIAELEISEDVGRPDVAAELGFRLAKIAHAHEVSPCDSGGLRHLVDEAIREVQASFRSFEMSRFTVEPSDFEIDEAILLCSRYDALYRAVDGDLVYCPSLRGVGFLDSCEADLATADTLIEVKTTTRRVSGRDLRQVLVYLALGAAQKSHSWSNFGIFNPRRAVISRISVDGFIAHVSGGKTVHEVYSEILSFSGSRDLLLEKSF